MSKYKITLEDNGQDFLYFIVENSRVVDCGPFQKEIWIGSVIPISMVETGKPCPIDNKYIKMGFLKYNVESIEEVSDEWINPLITKH